MSQNLGTNAKILGTNVLLVGEREVGELVQPGGILGLPWRLLNRLVVGRSKTMYSALS